MIDLRGIKDGTECVFAIKDGSGKKCEGLIRVSKYDKSSFYIEQNDAQGAEIEAEGMSKIKYRYTWIFQQLGPGVFSNGVQIFELIGLEVPKDDNLFISLSGKITEYGYVVGVEYTAIVNDIAVSGSTGSIGEMMDSIYNQVQNNQINTK